MKKEIAKAKKFSSNEKNEKVTKIKTGQQQNKNRKAEKFPSNEKNEKVTKIKTGQQQNKNRKDHAIL